MWVLRFHPEMEEKWPARKLGFWSMVGKSREMRECEDWRWLWPTTWLRAAMFLSWAQPYFLVALSLSTSSCLVLPSPKTVTCSSQGWFVQGFPLWCPAFPMSMLYLLSPGEAGIVCVSGPGSSCILQWGSKTRFWCNRKRRQLDLGLYFAKYAVQAAPLGINLLFIPQE